MPKEQPIEIFMPPNMLKAKVGGTIGGLDMAAVRRAEAAVETLKVEFADWVGEDVANLVRCRDRFARKRDTASRDELFRAAHDIKGQAATFEYPLIARVAGSLCKMLDALKTADAVPLNLVDAHVDAIRIVFRDKIRDSANRMAIELAEELEARVIETTERATV
ncbi:MAG TPA: Hpt domain-containing protein [Rhizomicrobium sp.]|nr:Hpt domain-containing protein [Rhizomicrobium sp.]